MPALPLLLWLAASYPAAASSAFGPETFVAQRGQLPLFQRSFTTHPIQAAYTLRVRNGVAGEHPRVLAAFVVLNGRLVVGSAQLNWWVAAFETPVSLAASNTLAVLLVTPPGGAIVVDIVPADPGDTTPPTITATSDPPPNAAGWNNSDVVVSFTCSDGGSGVATCPTPVTLASEGAGQIVSGTATDHAGNSATTSLTLNVDKTPPFVTPTLSPAPNAAGWNNSDVVVAFQAQDGLSGVLAVSTPATVATEGVAQPVSGQASDVAGNVGTGLASVNVDRTAPQLTLSAPAEGTLVRLPQVTVAGSADDRNGVVAVQINGAPVATGGTFEVSVPLASGAQAITVSARDVADNVATAGVTVTYRPLPRIEITSPADLAAFGTTPITVSGTVDDPEASVVVGLQRIPASVAGNTFTASGVPLQEGGNVVTAVATNAAGDSGTDSLTLVLDTTAPRVLIDSPPPGSFTSADSVTVSGRVHDVVLGTVNSGQAQVRVNGVPAAVSNRTFAARVPLVPGLNTVTATAVDAVGNSDTRALTLTRVDPVGERLAVVSGDSQSAGIGEELAEPLVVSVADAGGAALPGRTVIFRAAANNGALLDGQGQRRRAVSFVTDAQGQAQARLVLGTRAGVANNRVDASLVPDPPEAGVSAPPVTFTASGVAHPPAKINVDSGTGQKGIPGQPLPRPFVAVVTDEGHNRLVGVPVTFSVTLGAGDFNGSASVTVATDSDGRALAVLTLGPEPGVENNVVTASVENLAGLPAGFTASALEPGDPAQTRLRGVVLDNSNVPVPGVTLRIRGTTLAAPSDAQGQFELTGVPVGDVHLLADGSTAQRPGTWPSLEFEIVTVPGADNTLEMPIYLLPLDTASSVFVDETQGATLTLPDYPGFSLTVAPNSATFPDGTRRGTLSVTAVHVDKVPMVPNFGQQPRFIVTIQPPGVRFDPPAQVTHPNVDGLAPGEITEIYSFDHDMGSFVATGTATVSEDGLVLRADPGMGVVKGGWHCGGNPSTPGTPHDCPECQKCDPVKQCCVPDTSLFCKACTKDPGKACNASGACKYGRDMVPDLCSRQKITDVTYQGPITIPLTILGSTCGAAVRYCIIEVVESCEGTDLAQTTLYEDVVSDGGCTNKPGAVEIQSAGWPVDTGNAVLPSGISLVTGCALHGVDLFALYGSPSSFPRLPDGGSCTEMYTQQLRVDSCHVVTARIVFTLTRHGNTCTGTVTRR